VQKREGRYRFSLLAHFEAELDQARFHEIDSLLLVFD
jgi:hypothetical protein